MILALALPLDAITSNFWVAVSMSVPITAAPSATLRSSSDTSTDGPRIACMRVAADSRDGMARPSVMPSSSSPLIVSSALSPDPVMVVSAIDA